MIQRWDVRIYIPMYIMKMDLTIGNEDQMICIYPLDYILMSYFLLYDLCFLDKTDLKHFISETLND